MWLTGFAAVPESDLNSFGSNRILNRSDLIEAAVSAGLEPSQRMEGRIESITRVSITDVAVNGWVADRRGDATPINVFIFVRGKKIAATQTDGERADVTSALHLQLGAEENVVLGATFACAIGDQPVIAAITVDKRYMYLPAARCP
jgi:hypothetical protein